MNAPYPPRIDALMAHAHSISVQTEEVASYILDDPRFALWSAASKPHQHHYGDGGLQYHTWDVVRLCLANSGLFVNEHPEWAAELPLNEVYLAALAHDAGKMWDYERQPATAGLIKTWTQSDLPWRAAPHKRFIHHISRSAIEWEKAAVSAGFPEDATQRVTHAILAHHGTREWGSPVAPRSRLAWLLHTCDQMSARMGDADTLDVVHAFPA